MRAKEQTQQKENKQSMRKSPLARDKEHVKQKSYKQKVRNQERIQQRQYKQAVRKKSSKCAKNKSIDKLGITETLKSDCLKFKMLMKISKKKMQGKSI